jgi:hypothetical protein
MSGAKVKSGSFGFAEGSACVSGKAKYAVAEIQFFCAVGCFNFFLGRLVCRQFGLLVCVEIQRNCLPNLVVQKVWSRCQRSMD